jgi:nucleotide-binding universal stress UspA family protein
MIPAIKKILYTTDLSENARYAFGYAASLADRYDAKITIVHVLESLSENATMRLISILGEERWQQVQDRNVQEVLETIKARLEKFCNDMSAKLDQCSFVVEDIIVTTGQPVESILEQADKSGCDLIVMGTHGHKALSDSMLGSTARRVVRRSLKPVMVVRLPED